MASTEILIEKSQSFIQSWLSVEQQFQLQKGTLPKITEQAGPLALAINLAHIPVANVRETFEKNPDEIKNHPGVRTTFMVTKMLYPGWSSVAVKQGNEQPKPGKVTSNGKRGNKEHQAPEQKEKLSSMMGGHVLMHSFDLVNQRGTYVRNGKSEDCIVVSPGMLLTSKVWGNKFDKTFKDQTKDIEIFDMVLVQLGLHSITSSAKDNGSMLEIKAYTPIDNVNMSAFQILPSLLVPVNLQQFAICRSNFTDASHVQNTSFLKEYMGHSLVNILQSEDESNQLSTKYEIKGLNQEMIKMNISTSCSLVKIVPNQTNGVFATSSEDTIKFHVNQPLADVPVGSSALNIMYNPGDFFYGDAKNPTLETSAYKEWVVKQLNIFMLIEAVEMFVLIDMYKKTKASNPSDNESSEENSGSSPQLILNAYCRININVITEMLSSVTPTCALSDQCVVQCFQSQDMSAILKNASVYTCNVQNTPSSPLKFVLDTRVVSKNASVSNIYPSSKNKSTSMVHIQSEWERGNTMYVCYQDKVVHYFVVPICPKGTGASTTQMVLDAVNIQASINNTMFCYESPAEETNSDVSTVPENNSDGNTKASKKQKKTSA